MNKKVMFFIDGENLLLRYQSMLEKGYEPSGSIIHEKDIFVWSKKLILPEPRDILRVTYYTSVVGDEKKILSISNKIKELEYHYKSEPIVTEATVRVHGYVHRDTYTGNVFPRVFKKAQRQVRSKGVDLSIAIDMLNYASLGNVDALYLVSGDGDFIPLIQAVMRKGVQVNLLALSDGLNPELPISVDEFECIDSRLLRKIDNE